MKKSKVLREMVKILSTWEGSRLEIRTAKELLEKMDQLGVICAPETIVGYSLKRSTGELIPVYGMAWDKEGKKCEELEIIFEMA